MNIGDIFTKENYTEHAIWCNENNATITDLGGGKYQLVAIPEPLPPTKEEVAEIRKRLYTNLVDPITSHINRLKDEEQTEEVIAEIETLKIERSGVVAKIKEENPYPIELN